MAMDFGVLVPFTRHMGFELQWFEAGRAEVHYQALPEHLNSFNVTHGGALMTLLDITMATAARSVQKDMGLVTIEMKTSFMRPARGALVATCHLMHRTANLAFTEGTVQDAHGHVCAHATATFKFVRRLVAGPHSANETQQVATD